MAGHDLYEMMSTLRAVRRLRPDPIPADVLDRVLQAACWAPTGGNLQPWRIIVVRSDEGRRALADLYGPEWHTYTEFGRRRLEKQGASEEERARMERVYEKLVSNIQEVRARGAHVIAIASDGNEDIQHHADDVIYVPKAPAFLSAILAVIPLQLLAYRIARLRGLNVDQPRNLAKTVTVE